MIRVKIELCPMGDEERAREIGRMYIANDGATSAKDPKLGDYRVAVCRRGSTEVPREVYSQAHLDPDDARHFAEDHPKATRAGTVQGYPRLAYNVWRLIARAVLAAFPEERAPRNAKGGPELDSQVMQGLALLRQTEGAGSLSSQEFDALQAALQWLAAGERDDQ